MLDKLDIADQRRRPRGRAGALLTFVFVGGGYAGIEALAELEDMAMYATRYYPDLSKGDIRFVLVEATGRILPEVGEDMGRYTVERAARSAGSTSGSNTRLESCVDGHVVLSDGEEFDAETIVWTAGVKANPVLAKTGLPLDDKGRLRCRRGPAGRGCRRRLVGRRRRGGARPHREPGGCDQSRAPSTPSARPRCSATTSRWCCTAAAAHAYAHKHVGSVASLGLYKGVAQVYGVKLRGFPAWFMHRTYHVSRVPTFNRKVRVVLDWTLALFFRRDVVSLGSLQRPREEFSEATR